MKIENILLFSILCVVLMACDASQHAENMIANDTIIIGTGNEPGEYMCQIDGAFGFPSCLTIVKFYNPDMENKLIVQQPFQKYDGIEGKYIYYNHIFCLNILPESFQRQNGCGLDIGLVQWADKELKLSGTSPYIPLAKGYYLVDWKWHQLLPISAIANSISNAYYNPLSEHILHHVFTTDVDWKYLKELTMVIDSSSSVQPINGIEIIRVLIKELACFYHDDIVDSDPYVCWNNSLYYEEGMSLINAYTYYSNGDCTNSGKSHSSYAAYCDSLQTVYQKRLIEIINDGQLKEIGY